ncbi:alpha/beta hydrolase family protein [Altericroceibacterium xinjiangense]|uniref:alpha/beta hydrolase family protein n=1 Tax=Altericroceibacterium xinjiangense TaxID=762261 RepID=UPI000F7F5B27|nr:S9 family peptidase [Altericroceibacterium xinjiangense]
MPNFRNALLRFAACVVVLPGTPAAAQPVQPPPLTAYGSLPDFEMMELSDSGAHIAAVATAQGKRLLIVFDREMQPLRKMEIGDVKVRGIDWVGDEWALLTMTRTEQIDTGRYPEKVEVGRVAIIPARGAGKIRFVFGDQPTTFPAVFGSFGTRKIEGKWHGFFSGLELVRSRGGYALPHPRPALYSVDFETNQAVRIADASPPGGDADWLIGADGSVVATLRIDYAGSWTIEGAGGQIASGKARTGDVDIVALGPRGDTMIYQQTDPESGTTQWLEAPLDGNAPPHRFLDQAEVDRYFTHVDGRLLGYRSKTTGHPHFFAVEHQKVADRIDRAFPAVDVRLSDWTADFTHALVRTSGNRDSGTWYRVDMDAMRANSIAYERFSILPEQVGPIRTISYTAADGLELDGILTLPPGRPAKDLPLVMLPHGGPHAHDDAAFDWWAQAFASRGYAVFQPNFRGSTNRDDAFVRAGHKEWGRKMQTDISDGLAELARQGVVDPRRACIVGASYGGYAALVGVTMQQGVYRCAVAVAPIADLPLMYPIDYYLNRSGRFFRLSLTEELGSRTGFDDISPSRFARQADAPILLIHGRDDTVVPFEQSEKMADALKRANKPFRLVELEDEDHWLSRSRTRNQMLTEAVAFVQAHNPVD